MGTSQSRTIDRLMLGVEKSRMSRLVRSGNLPYERADPHHRPNLTGTNVGNMLFQQAVVKPCRRLTPTFCRTAMRRRCPDVDRINDNFDVWVRSLSNRGRSSRTDSESRLLRMVTRHAVGL